MALAAALMITAVPADVAFAAPSEQEAVETADETAVFDEELEEAAVPDETADGSEEEATEPTEEVTDTEGEAKEPTGEVTDTEGEAKEPTGEVTDTEGEAKEPTGEVTDTEGEAKEPTGEVTDTEGETKEPTEEVTDTEGEAKEPTEEVTDTEGEAKEPTGEVTDTEGEAKEPTGEVTDTEGEAKEPTGEVTDTEGEAAESTEEVTDTEGEAAEPTKETVVTEKETVEASKSAEKPTRLTLSIDERDGELRWTPYAGAQKYEIKVTDGVYEYYEDIIDVSKEGEAEKLEAQYYSVSSSSNRDSVTAYISELKYLRAKDPNKAEFVYNTEKGSYVYPNVPGTSYTYSVRAVNQIVTKDPATGADVYGDYVRGDWSNAVSYQEPGTVVQITDLKYVGCDKELLNGEDAYVVSFSANITNGSVYAELSKDRTFANENYEESMPQSGYLRMRNNKYYLPESWMRDYAGSTVFVRVYNRDGDNYLKDQAGKPLYSDVISIAVPAEEKPVAPAIKNLKIEKEDSSGYVFTFDAALDEKKDQQFELQYSKDAAFPKEGENAYKYVSGSSRDDSLRIYYDDIDADAVYHVRAVSRVWVDGHEENGQWVDGAYLYGTPSNTVQIIRKSAVSTISKLALKETTQSGFVLGYSGKLAENEEIEVQVSSKKSFPADIDTALVNGKVYSYAKTFTLNSVNDGDTAKKIMVDYSELGKPGTYYVRARVIKTYPSADAKNDTMENYAFSSYTNVVKVKMQVSDATITSKDVTSKSVTLVMGAEDGVAGGYELQKKVGKSWKRLARTTDDNYVDSGLEKDVKYSYRARVFWRNNATGKTYNGEWTYFSVTTWGANLTLTAESASATSAKLSWNKISGAEGYEVYRMESHSPSSKQENYKENIYHKYQLIKTLSSSKTTYTDKKLSKNEEYYYYVRAYKTVDGKKSYIQSNEDGVALKFGASIVLTSQEQASNGKVTVTWKKVASAKGYYVEKLDTKTGKYKKYKKITKNKTTKITLPAVKDPEKPETYRIRAYKDSKNGSTKVTEYSDAAKVTVNVYLKAPTSVKAVAQDDGSVKVSWKKVKGADYYVVYRTTSSSYTYNKSSKKYTYTNGTPINVYKADSASTTGYTLLDAEDVKGTSVVDRSVKKKNARNEEIEQNRTAPRPGYTYYYYVVAVKKGAAEQYVDSEDTYSSAHSKAAKAVVTNASLSAPKSVKVKAAKSKVTVSWKAVTDAEGYEVLRATKKNGTYEVVGTVDKGTTKKYVDKTAEAGKTYYYKVRSVKANEAGADSYSVDSSAKKVKAK